MNSIRCVSVVLSAAVMPGRSKIQQLRRVSQFAGSVTSPPAGLQVNTQQVHSQQVTKYMRYLSVDQHQAHATRPVVVIYGWLTSKEKHYKKIHDFYLGQGFDVVKLQVTARMQLWPVTIRPVLENLLEFLLDKENSCRPVLLHGFSIGGYMYAHTIYQILENPDRYGPVAERMLGHVSDSPVDVVGAASGLAQSVTDSRPLQTVIEKSLDSYLALFKKQCTDYMWTAHKMYHGNPLGLPVLYLYSPNDAISSVGPIYKSMGHLREQNVPYFEQIFDTPHVQHFRRYPELYCRAVQDFLDYLKIKDSNPPIRKDVHKRIAEFPL